MCCGPQKLVSITSITLAARDSLYASTRDYVRAGLEVLYVLFTLLYLVEEINQVRRARRGPASAVRPG